MPQVSLDPHDVRKSYLGEDVSCLAENINQMRLTLNVVFREMEVAELPMEIEKNLLNEMNIRKTK